MHRGSNSTNAYSAFLAHLLAAACVSLAGCGGTALLNKEARPLESSRPLAEAKDERVLVSIESVILRNGAGSWASDADWDEYLIRIRSFSDEPVEIREVAIFDALDQRIAPRSDRGELVDGTREIEQRYAKSGQLVRAREGGGGWVGTGAGMVTSAAGGAALTAPAGFAGLATVSAAALVVTGVGVVFAGADVMRLVNNAKVNSEIKRRQTAFPVALPGGAEASVDLFFPLTPLSGRTQVVYADRHGEHRLDIDTRVALTELDPPPVLVTRHEPEFPNLARRHGITQGHVIAHLALDRQGRVQGVEVIESVPPGIFDAEARWTFQTWGPTPRAATVAPARRGSSSSSKARRCSQAIKT